MKSFKTIDEYIASYPKATQALLKQMRVTIKKAAPKAGVAEKIGYGIPTFTLGGRNLVHFGGYAKHIGFYPGPAGLTAFKGEIAKRGYECSKGTVQFPIGKPLPLALVAKITKFRVGQELKKNMLL